MGDVVIAGRALGVDTGQAIEWRWEVGESKGKRMARAEGQNNPILCWRDGLRDVTLAMDPLGVLQSRAAFEAEVERRVAGAVGGASDRDEQLRLAADAIARLWAEPAVYELFPLTTSGQGASAAAPAADPSPYRPAPALGYILSPAETQPLRNTATMADHALLVSALTVCLLDLIWMLTDGGVKPGCRDILGLLAPDFSFGGRARLLHAARIAALLHDVGKPFASDPGKVGAGGLPPFGSGHAPYSTEFVQKLLARVFPGAGSMPVSVGEWAGHRWPDHKKPPPPAPEVGMRALINLADVIAESDRAKSLPECWRGKAPSPEELAAALGEANVPQRASFSRQNVAQLAQALPGLGLDTPPLGLLMLHVDRPSQYIFEGRHLPEIRGGSLLLRHLDTNPLEPQAAGTNRAARPKTPAGGGLGPRAADIIARDLAPECVLFSGGGRVLALMPYPRAAQIARELRELYAGATQGSAVGVAVVGLDWPELAYGLAPARVWFEYPGRAGSSSGYDWTAGPLLDDFWTEDPGDSDALKDRPSAWDIHNKDQTGPVIDAILRRKNFGEVHAHLEGLAAEAAGLAPVSQPYLETPPVFRRCQSCGYRPAEGKPVALGPSGEGQAAGAYQSETIHVCPVCRRRRNEGRDRSLLLEELFPGKFPGSGDWLRPSADLDEIGRHARAGDEEGTGGYVALVHADVNGMGRTLRSADTPGEFRRLSTEVDRAILESLRDALEPLAEPMFEKVADMQAKGAAVEPGDGTDKVPLPIELIFRGGDECLFIVPGEFGLHAAVTLLKGFENRMTLGGRVLAEGLCTAPALTMSAAVVIMHSRFPITLARRVAHDLLHKSAKRLARAATPWRSALDFAVLRRSQVLSQPIFHHRMAALQPQRRSVMAGPFPSVPEPCRWGQLPGALTCRPLYLDEAEGLLQAIGRLRRVEFPGHQLHLLAEAALKQSEQEARLTWRYQWARMSDQQAVALQEALGWLREEGEYPAPMSPFATLCRRRGCDCEGGGTDCSTYHVCPLIDILEAWDFIRSPQG